MLIILLLIIALYIFSTEVNMGIIIWLGAGAVDWELEDLSSLCVFAVALLWDFAQISYTSLCFCLFPIICLF